MWDAPWHWVVLAIIVIALFGYKRLPDAARSLGRSMRIFKTEVKGMSEDDKKRAAAKNEKPKAIEAPSANGASSANAVDARVVEPPPVRAEADGGLAHTVAETAPRPRPRPTPNP